MDFLKMAQEIKDDLIKWRRGLHQIPEIGLELPQTTDYICKVLDEMEVDYQRAYGTECGIVASLGKGSSGKCLALRADTDALLVKEETGLDFASTNGKMHACGHDAHAAILLAAIKVIKEIEDKLDGRVKFIFQPGEEISAGAQPMIEAGVMGDVDFILGIHVGTVSSGPSGIISTKEGPLMACLDNFELRVRGLGAHGAYPHTGVDPIYIASSIIVNLQEVISREINPLEPAVISIGMIEGGTVYNVIPEEVIIKGTARSVNHETREYVAKRIGEISKGIAQSLRGSVDYDYSFGAPPLINDSEISQRAYASAVRALGEESVQWQDNPVMGGEDFAYYLLEKPGAYMFLNTPMPIDGVVYANHNPKFAIDENQLKKGVAFFAQAVYDYLG